MDKSSFIIVRFLAGRKLEHIFSRHDCEEINSDHKFIISRVRVETVAL